MFEKIKVISLKYKTSELPSKPKNKFILPALTAGIQNQGLNNYVPKQNTTILKNVISISANGANTGATFYQSKEFTVLQDAYAIKWKNTDDILIDNHYLFLVGAVSKSIFGNYEWTNKAVWERIKPEIIQLPTKNDKIDFEFMESFIAELEAQRIKELKAYLLASGLNDYELTREEKNAIGELNKGEVEWVEYRLGDLFDIGTGSLLSNSELMDGEIPRISVKSDNNGILGYFHTEDVSNARHLENFVTVNFFGTDGGIFYHPYKASVEMKVHTLKIKGKDFNLKTGNFICTSLKLSLKGFGYGNQLSSSKLKELDFKIQLPTRKNTIDFSYMETLISALQKLAIKDVVLYSNSKTSYAKTIINK